MVYAVSLTSDSGSPATLMCFDVDPEQDLDGDGAPDDGLPDYSQGKPYDMIWSALLTGVVNNPSPRFSSPTLATINVNNGTIEVPVQVVLVSVVDTQSGAAAVACYNATTDPAILAALPGGYAGTGQVIWTYPVPAYSGTAEVVCLSTPIIHRGYVYVLASEYDTALAAGVEGTYGRAHCFDLATGGGTATWVYPTPLTDIDGDGTAGLNAEHQRSLPTFNEPEWVAQGPARRDLPYSRGAIPVLSNIADRVDGIGVDALLSFGTPVTHEWNPAGGGIVQIAGWTSWINRDGGSEFALVPTPRSAAGSVMLNEQYFRVRLNHQETDGNPANDTVNATVRTDDPGIGLVSLAWDGSRYAVYEPGQVREALAARSATGIDDPIQLQTGAQVLVDYTYDGNAVTGEPHWLPGPVRWKHEFGPAEARNCEGGAGSRDMVVTTEVPVDTTGTPAASSGKVFLLDGNTGRPQWTYDPKEASPFSPATKATMQIQATTSPAFDADTAVVGATAVYQDPPGTDRATSAVIGLRRQNDCSVRLRGTPGVTLDGWGVAITENQAFTVTLTATGDTIDPTCYRVDRVSRYLTFPADKANNVMNTTGTSLGPIYGRAIEVDWWDDNGTPNIPNDPLLNPAAAHHVAEPHVMPGLERFYYMAGHIRLRYYPVDWSAGNEPIITLLDGTPIDAGSFVPANLVANTAVDGWIDMRGATIGGGASPVPAGTDVLVSYRGFSERVGAYIVIPDPILNLPAERHQIPIEFGPSASAPAVAGATIHLGTEGFDGDLNGTLDDPAGPAGPADTLLSLIWDKATGLVRSALSQPSVHHGSYDAPNATIGVVSSAPTVAEDRVFVGSRLMLAAPPVPGQGIGYGFVSGMKPRRLLIADNTRLVETTGGEPSWVCTATLSPQRGQSFVGEEFRRPFSRPAKATRLPNGNLLVVDTGNNRVVEIDRSGRVIWPLDPYGYEYYTSPDNHTLRLSRPADAYRFIIQTPGGPEYHTTIADTGNGRVIEVVTTIVNGQQQHEVYVKTPGRVRLNTTPTRYMRVRYTSAQPIFDPGNRWVIGYLCAAANLNQLLIVENGSKLINPPGSRATPVGSSPGSTWAYWAWLYDDDLSDASDLADDPLLFDNIKHAEYARYGGTIYLTVTCSRYRGRAKAAAPHALAAAGPGVFEFRIDVSGAPNTWGVMNALDRTGTPSIEEPYWHFVGGTGAGADAYGYWYYYDGAAVAQRDMTHIDTAAGTYRKRWYPVCAKRMADGRHLIVNSISAIAHATQTNIAAGEADTPLGSHIFQVETINANENDPYNDLYVIPASRSVPEPNQPAWADPFNQPAYAEVE